MERGYEYKQKDRVKEDKKETLKVRSEAGLSV